MTKFSRPQSAPTDEENLPEHKILGSQPEALGTQTHVTQVTAETTDTKFLWSLFTESPPPNYNKSFIPYSNHGHPGYPCVILNKLPHFWVLVSYSVK